MPDLAHILRDPHERWRRCSLYPLRERGDLRIISTKDADLDGFRACTLLRPDAPPLGRADAGRPLLLVDASWRRARRILDALALHNEPRSIPGGFHTAYPRRSEIYIDPAAGLATVEALYLALRILDLRDDSLLDGYRWREAFFAINRERLATLETS